MSRLRRTFRVSTLALGVLLLSLAPLRGAALSAEGIFHEDFEGAQPTWAVLASDTTHHVDEHQRVGDPVHTGAWSESLSVSASDGTYIHFGRSLGAAQVINELRVSLFVMAERSGPQLIARVVLPRSVDPQTGQPQTLLLYGPLIERAGQWQELVLDHIPQQLERQARVAQSSLARALDVREAYVDAVMLNVYGGRGRSRVWIDDLAVSGFVGREPKIASTDSAVRPVAYEESPTRRAAGDIALRGGLLTLNGRPLLPRLIQHRGESLLYLKQLGFNGITLSAPPTGTLLAEAAENRMWIVCTPPPLSNGATLGREFDPVLAWDLGQGLSQRELPAVEALVKQLRQADRDVRRPILCDALTDLRAYSELTDVMVMGRHAIGTSLELSDYATWQQQRSRMLRPGTPFWHRLQTQPDEAWVQQLIALSSGAPPIVDFSSRQLRQLAFMAVAGGARGLVFESRTSLEGNDSSARRRASLLKLINLELTLVEGWAAAGGFVTPASVNDRPAGSFAPPQIASDAAVAAAVIQTDRARLLLPLRFARGDQFVIDEGAGGDMTFIVPGVPESNDAFELTSAGLRPLPHRRVTGGMSVTLRDVPPAALIALTQDPLVIDNLTRLAMNERHAVAELSRQLSADEIGQVTEVDRQLSAAGLSVPIVAQRLTAARQQLKVCDAAFATGDYPQTIQASREVQRPLQQARRAHWDRMAQRLSSPMMLPSAQSFNTLPLCASLVEGLRSARVGENLLPGGDCEDLDLMRRTQWQHFQLPQRRLVTEVELSAAGPHSGRTSLHLSAGPAQGETPPPFVESSPLWITTAPVAVEAHSLLLIHGWVRVPRPITGSVDGLLIIDSLGGEAMAERVGQTRGWQEFSLYRAVPATGSLSVTFALSGLGEAFLDDVTISRVTMPSR